jgi:hypothetical protein
MVDWGGFTAIPPYDPLVVLTVQGLSVCSTRTLGSSVGRLLNNSRASFEFVLSVFLSDTFRDYISTQSEFIRRAATCLQTN